jgi:hypothetical protein
VIGKLGLQKQMRTSQSITIQKNELPQNEPVIDPEKPTNPSDNHPKKLRRGSTTKSKKSTTKQKKKMPYTDKKKRVCANSMGSKLTVHLPVHTKTSNNGNDGATPDEEDSVTSAASKEESDDASEEKSDDDMSVDVSKMENDITGGTGRENNWILYDDLQENHYQYDSNHHHEDNNCYYKGFQHLCNLRKPTPLSEVPYGALPSREKFTDEAFHEVFGADLNKCDTNNFSNASTHELNRFEDDTSGENPIVGIKYDGLSQSIANTIINIAKTREFLKDQAGKYIRAATTEPCEGYRVPHFPDSEEYSRCERMYPLFRIGQKEDSSARLFKGIAATPEETHLLDLVNQFSKRVLGGVH